MRDSAGYRTRTLVLTLCFALVGAACGNRLSREEVLADNTVSDSGRVASSSGDLVAQGGAGASDGEPSTDAASGSQAAQGGTGGGASAARTAGQAAQSGRATANKAPLKIGLIGWFGGIGGGVHIPKRDAFLVWQKMVNARGGINGHPVEVLVGDHGGNQSQAVAIARDFVENKGALALSVTGSVEGGAVDYATKKGVPIIGVSSGPPEHDKTPLMFKTGPGSDGSTWGLVRMSKNLGATKLAVIFCAESVACEQGANDYAVEAQKQGMQVVYQGRASVTQPDYTAECLQARNSGAELIYPLTDNTAPVRIAQSCARQSYRPIWLIGSASDEQARVPELDGAAGAVGAFPWMLRSGAPGIDEYVQAFQKYLPRRLEDGTTDQAAAWVAAKVFELAAAKVSDQPKSQEIVEGLWAMKGETLGGLMTNCLARTYVRNQPTPPSFAAVPIRLQGGKWNATQGLSPLCR